MAKRVATVKELSLKLEREDLAATGVRAKLTMARNNIILTIIN